MGEHGLDIILFLFFSVFVLLLLFFHGWYMIVCCLFLIVPFLLSLTMVHLIRHYYAWNLLYLFCKTISNVRFLITTLWILLKKGERFDISHSLGSLRYLIQSELDF